MKKEGKSKILFDEIDYQILANIILNDNKIRIMHLRKIIGLAHPNLQTHLRRLSECINRNRDKQTIYLSVNKRGVIVLNHLLLLIGLHNDAFGKGDSEPTKQEVNNMKKYIGEVTRDLKKKNF